MTGPSGGSLEDRLRALRAKNVDISAAVVATLDGLPVASAAASEADPDGVAALAADLLQRAGRATEDVGAGAAQQVLVKGERGYLMAVACGPEACLGCAASLEASLGLLLLDVQRAADDLKGMV